MISFVEPVSVLMSAPREFFLWPTGDDVPPSGGDDAAARARASHEPASVRPSAQSSGPRRSQRLAEQKQKEQPASKPRGGGKKKEDKDVDERPVGVAGRPAQGSGEAVGASRVGVGARSAVTVSPPTQKQIDYIAIICARRGWDFDLVMLGLDKALASRWIDQNR